MSMTIRAARAAAGATLPGYGSVRAHPRGMPMGDPGIFGDIWGGIKGAIGGAVKGFIGSPKPPPPPLPTWTMPPGMTLPTLIQQNGGRPPTTGESIARFLPGGKTGFEAQTEEQMRAGKRDGLPAGWHWNKSGHFLKGGEYVYPGTKPVKNRKMNPLNPAAASSSMRRLGRAKTAVTDINRVTIRKKKCGSCK